MSKNICQDADLCISIQISLTPLSLSKFTLKSYTYILKSEKYDQYYIGQTNSIENRLKRHNAGLEKYTKKYRPWKLLLDIEKDSRSEAIILERKLKNLGSKRLLQFIEKYS